MQNYRALTALILAGSLATGGSTAAAQAIQPVPIQGWVAIQPDPTEVAIQREREFAAIDAWSKHMEDQYYRALARSNAHLNCVVAAWHPENCE